VSATGSTQAAGALARAALGRFPVTDMVRLELVRHGENTVYRVHTTGGSYALRVHRPGYHTAQEVRSEIAWIGALRDAGVVTPEPIPGTDGDPVQVVGDAGDPRMAVLFRWMEGESLARSGGIAPWRHLGEVMARIHEHGRTWTRPARFARPSWDRDALTGPEPRWGPPDPHRLLAPDDRGLLLRATEEVGDRLDALGRGPDRYGLIHGDLGFDNVLIDPRGRAVVIDFDDSGDGWYLYELAVALYPHEGSADFDARRTALIEGYRSVAGLPEELVAELPTFLMARRLVSLGWVFSRAETDHAHEQRPRRLATTPAAVRRYLAWAAAQPRPAGT
jgi:Ser/Thr protein kinase RdoA (MazF antagonist)